MTKVVAYFRQKERIWLGLVSGSMATFLVGDIAFDIFEGQKLIHIWLEIILATLSLGMLGILSLGYLKAKERSLLLQSEVRKLIDLNEKLNEKNTSYSKEILIRIDQQFEDWHLTSSEKDIALLIIKGLSYKEIAELRQTAEKTVRTQASNIFSKTGLANRSELSAYFIEDLFS